MIIILHHITRDHNTQAGVKRPWWIRNGAGRLRYWTNGERFDKPNQVGV